MGLVSAFNKVMDGVTGAITGTPAQKAAPATTATPAEGAAPQQGFMSHMMQNPMQAMQKIQQAGQVFQQPANTAAPIQEPNSAETSPQYDLATIGQQVATLQTQVAALQTYVNQLSDYLYAHHEDQKPSPQVSKTETTTVTTNPDTPLASIDMADSDGQVASKSSNDTLIENTIKEDKSPDNTGIATDIPTPTQVDQKPPAYVVIEPQQASKPA